MKALVAALKALPALLRIGFAEAVAYRAEMLVWVFSTTMPVVMMLLWTTVASVAPVVGQGGKAWGSQDFIAYFLSVFIVRQLISAWASWETGGRPSCWPWGPTACTSSRPGQGPCAVWTP